MTGATSSCRWTPTCLIRLSRCPRCSKGLTRQTWSLAPGTPPADASTPVGALKRRLLSAFGNHTIRLVTGVSVRDVTSGFKLFKADVLRSLDVSALRCKGFGFQAELAHHCQAGGYKVVEHPITFIDRIRGQSKMSLHIVVEAIWRLSLLRLRNILTSAKSRLPSFWGIG